MKKLPTFILTCASVVSCPLLADDPIQRYGAVRDSDKSVQVEGGFTTTLQSSSDSRIKDEALLSFDLVATIPTGVGKWTTYIEGNISPRLNGVSTLLAEVNGDAGSSLDRDNKGRLQISELHYSRYFNENNMTIGLINPAGILDASEVANDETSQFLSSSFVNNPTIGFPDYTLGTSMHFEEGKTGPGFTLLLSSSHGLADNTNHSYSELVDVSANGKGIFLAGEMYWTSAKSKWHLGIWSNSADHETLDGSGNKESNYGAFLSTDHNFENTKLNLRVGVANENVSEAASFASLAIETPFADHTLGAGLAKTVVSNKVSNNKGDSTQAEVYVRFDLDKNLHITPSLQYIENSGFDSSNSSFNKNITVYSVRASYSF